MPCLPISNHRAFEENKPPLKGEGDRRQAVERSLCEIFYYAFSVSGDPSVSAAHCQLPFQGSLKSDLVGTRRAVSAYFLTRKKPLKTFHRNVFKIKKQQAGHRAERSCSLRPRKAVAFLTHLLRAPEHGAGNFAVCGQRLRGHVPSKNTSPAALSWSSLIR